MIYDGDGRLVLAKPFYSESRVAIVISLLEGLDQTPHEAQAPARERA